MNILEWEKVNTKWELSDIEIKLDTLCEIDDGIVTKMESTRCSQVTAKCFVTTFCLNLLINHFLHHFFQIYQTVDFNHRKHNMLNMTLWLLIELSTDFIISNEGNWITLPTLLPSSLTQPPPTLNEMGGSSGFLLTVTFQV